MSTELDELRACIAKLRTADRYLLAELILTDIRLEAIEQRETSRASQKAEYDRIRSEEAAAKKGKSARREATRAAG